MEVINALLGEALQSFATGCRLFSCNVMFWTIRQAVFGDRPSYGSENLLCRGFMTGASMHHAFVNRL
jgi:hypothetical protein